MDTNESLSLNTETALPPVSAPAPVPPSGGSIRPIFIGPNGLRAGWRLAIYVALIVALSSGIRVLNHAIRGPQPKHTPEQTAAEIAGHPVKMIIGEGISFLIVLFACYVMSKIEKRPLGWYGIGRRDAFGRRFWEGCLWGFASLSLLLVFLRLSGAFYFGEVANHGTELLKFGVLWGIGFLLVGFFEEYAFRGYLQYTLTTGLGFWGTTILLSGLFTYAHTGNAGETTIGLIDVFLAGVVLALMLQRTGNLWFPIGFHAAWDWAQSFFYGVADSGLQTKGTLLSPHIPTNKPDWLTGGTVGPEGSVLSALMELFLIALILWRFRKVKYPEGINPEKRTLEPAPAVISAA